MLTKYAAGHGVADLATSLLTDATKGIASAKAQKALAAANFRAPANTDAAGQVTDALVKAFGAAGVGGVSMPNIPQMGCYWQFVGGGWTSIFNVSIKDRKDADEVLQKVQADVLKCATS